MLFDTFSVLPFLLYYQKEIFVSICNTNPLNLCWSYHKLVYQPKIIKQLKLQDNNIVQCQGSLTCLLVFMQGIPEEFQVVKLLNIFPAINCQHLNENCFSTCYEQYSVRFKGIYTHYDEGRYIIFMEEVLFLTKN